MTRKPVQTLGKPEIIIIYPLLLPEVILPHNYLELIPRQPRDIRKQLRDIRMQLWNNSARRESFNSRSRRINNDLNQVVASSGFSENKGFGGWGTQSRGLMKPGLGRSY